MRKILLLVLPFICLSARAQKHAYSIVKTYHIESGGGWDYIAVHHNKLYVSHGTQVNILDEATGDSIGIIPHTNGVHGIAFDDKLKRGYTSNGRSNSVTVFDENDQRIIDSFPAGENPDAIMYEPFTQAIITCNGKSRDLSIIDPASGKVTHTIAVDGKPETAVSDGAGNLFVNIEDKNEIVQVSLKNFTVLHRWPLGAEGPTGLAYDNQTKRLFAGCDNQLVVVNAGTGKVESKVPIGAGCDGVVFDAGKRLIFTSNGSGTLTVIKEEDANRFTIEGNYPTKRGARTLAIDEKDGSIFLPTAEFESAETQNGRPKMIPGTFQVLVVK